MRTRLWAVAELANSKGADTDPAVTTLTKALADDRFYGVRMAAAESLGALGTSAGTQALLAALSQKDDRVRTAVASALTQSAGDAAVYRALVGLLQQDRSYAVRAAAAQAIGRSKQADAFQVLQAALAARPEVHVARAIEGALAATGDPKAVPILLGYARPGAPVRLRLSALSALGSMSAAGRLRRWWGRRCTIPMSCCNGKLRVWWRHSISRSTRMSCATRRRAYPAPGNGLPPQMRSSD
jgi:aminopeptidase N